MKLKAVSGIMLTLLLIGMLTLAFNIQSAKASGTIYIGSDYTFTSDIYEPIVVTADNIIIDGNGYTLQGTGSGYGIDLTERSNVTIKNVQIKMFEYGIWSSSSSNNNTISGNNVANNGLGIRLYHGSNYNAIFHNNFVNNSDQVYTYESENVWDDGYPSGGNYWSDHVCAGNPSDGSQPYIINALNIDHYPFQDPNGWLLPPPPPKYTLTIYSSPTEVTFTVDGVSPTTPWSGTYSENTSVSLIVPETYTVGDARYYWNQWSDGNTGRSRTVTMTTNITLTAYYTGPHYELTVTSSPMTGITFTINGTPQTTPYTEWLLEDSYTLEMPETHDEFVWSHWLEDGDTNRIKTVTMNTNILLTAVFTPPDTTPPTISIISPENKTYPVADVPLTFTVSESTSWIGYSLDGQTNVTITENITLSGLSDRSHYVVVYANDTIGNMGASSTVYLTVDTTEPIANAGVDQTVAEDTLTTFDASASWDQNGIATCTWTFIDTTPQTLSGENPIYTFTTPGTYIVTLTVEDPAGNTATDTVTITVLLDTDGDGTPDTTDPDDDNDGIPDTWETENGLNPLDAADASLDPDGDGLTNLQEYQEDTDPNVSDAEGVPLWILGAIAAVLIGIAAATAAFLLRRRK